MSQKQADIKPLNRIISALKKTASVVVPTLACTVAALYITSVYSADIAIEASINGTSIGKVESNTALMSARSELQSTVYTLTEGKYETNFDIDYNFVKAESDNYLSYSDCYSIFWNDIDEDFTEAYMLYVDDRQAAANESEEELKGLIEDIEAQLLKCAGDSFSDVQISSRIRIEKQYCLKSMIRPIDEINELVNPVAHMTTRDEPEQVNTRIGSLIASTPAVASAQEEPEQASDDTEDLTIHYNLLNNVTLDEVIYFETVYVDDETNFVGNEKVVCEGANGAKTVTYEIVYDSDGKIIGRNVISETITSEVQNKVILVGTAPIPDAVPTGSLIWPCEQPKGVSSYYGWRDLYGKQDFHLGIDIPDAKGSPIWAADGGEVIFTGYTPSYGYSVRIQHSDSLVTLYAHLDKIHVKVGDKVYQKQQIGTMGRTGVAYGVHLHFEVRINNQTTDPLKHLPKK